MQTQPKSNFEIGQTVWVRLNHPRLKMSPSPHTITRMGRKWATVGNDLYRFDIKTLELDGQGYSSPGRVYLSEEHYAQETALTSAWDTLRTRARDTLEAPAGVTAEHILQALKLLGLDP